MAQPWVAAVLGAVALTACGQSTAGGDDSGRVAVEVAIARAEDVPVTTSTIGTLEANSAAQLRAEVEGQITALLVPEGASVAAGTPLLRIDVDRYQLALASASARREQAAAQYANDSVLLERSQPLLAAGAIGPQALEDVRTRAQLSRAALQAAEAASALARRDVERASVPAPFAGQFAARSVDLGDYVRVGDQLGELVDARTLRLTFDLPEEEAVGVAPGQPVLFEVTARPGRTYRGDVYYVAPVVKEATRTTTIKARVANPGLELRPGMSVALRVTTGTQRGAVVVPEVAVRRDMDRSYLFTIENGRARRRDVRAGIRPTPGLIVITEGIRAGDSVVVAGFQKVQDSTAVTSRVVAAPGGTAATRRQ